MGEKILRVSIWMALVTRSHVSATFTKTVFQG